MTDSSLTKKTPTVLWAQRADKLFITLNIQDATNGKLNATENSFHYTCQSESEKAAFEVDLVFYNDIDSANITQHCSGRCVEFVIPKANKEESYWPRLLKSAVKPSYVQTDFNKWKDEDEEDEDSVDPMNPYANFANFDASQFAAGGDYDEEDDEEEQDAGETHHHEHKHDGNCCH